LKIASQARRKFAVGKYCESLKNLQNFKKHHSSNAFQSFLESRTFAIFATGEFAPNEVRMFPKKVLVGVRGQSPLKKRFTG
jgi:hypothetical protein